MVTPVGQVIVISVGDIIKPAFFGDDVDSVDRTAACVPAGGSVARDFGVQFDRGFHIGALCIGVVIFIFDPLQPVAGDFPVRGLHGGNLRRGTRERGGNAIDRGADVHFIEQTVQPPEAGARAIFIDVFHVPVALAIPLRGTDDLRQEGFRRFIPVQNAVFPAFFIIHHKLHGNFRTIRPFRVGCFCAIAKHVTRVVLHDVSSFADC